MRSRFMTLPSVENCMHDISAYLTSLRVPGKRNLRKPMANDIFTPTLPPGPLEDAFLVIHREMEF